MANRRLIRVALLAAGVTSIVAAGRATVRVRAQVATIQPFVAIMIEEMSPRQDQPPTPITRLQTIAVRSDGSISMVTKLDARLPIRRIYSREVIDRKTKTHVVVEDQTHTIVKDEYSDMQVLKPGVPCEGKPAGQIEGFDVVYSEQPMEPVDETQVIHKQWLAPGLGCYPIVQEWVGKHYGQFMDTKQTLVSLKLGEPDPWYFAVPGNYATRTGEQLWELLKPMLKQ